MRVVWLLRQVGLEDLEPVKRLVLEDDIGFQHVWDWWCTLCSLSLSDLRTEDAEFCVLSLRMVKRLLLGTCSLQHVWAEL